jgi:hypothetical protein
MKVSILDLHCLNAIADDYERTVSIIDDVRRSSHGNVEATDVAVCLAELVRDGFAGAYRFDGTTGRYEPVMTMPPQDDSLWFRITDSGRRQLDEHWVED